MTSLNTRRVTDRQANLVSDICERGLGHCAGDSYLRRLVGQLLKRGFINPVSIATSDDGTPTRSTVTRARLSDEGKQWALHWRWVRRAFTPYFAKLAQAPDTPKAERLNPLMCPECGENANKVVETYSRYMSVRYDTKTQRFVIDTAWPPDLDDGADDYELQCSDCYHQWRLPLTKGGHCYAGDE